MSWLMGCGHSQGAPNMNNLSPYPMQSYTGEDSEIKSIGGSWRLAFGHQPGYTPALDSFINALKQHRIPTLTLISHKTHNSKQATDFWIFQNNNI